MNEQFEAIYAAIAYVEDHLHKPVGAGDMAAAAGYSLFHFVRTFNRVVHHTPYDYLMRRRLTEAARELVSSEQLILDISIRYCFNNPETFSRAFRRMFAIQPSQFRTQGSLDPRQLQSPLTLAYLQHLHQGTYLRPEIVEGAPLHLAGLMTQPMLPEDILALWQHLGMDNLTPTAPAYGVTTYTPDGQPDFYLAAFQIETTAQPPVSLVTKTIPAGMFARFIHKGSAETLSLSRDYIYQTWLPKSGCKLAYPLEIEYFDKGWQARTEPTGEWQVLIPVSIPPETLQMS
ncbi:MAG: AraC family transcriptional regulator [Anaerolineales bacterium]|nr:AraC family transcriptional regulator [Anaerolineales bacterium]